MNQITIELCAQDRIRLDKIIDLLEQSRPQCQNCVQLVNDLHTIKQSPTDATGDEYGTTPTNTKPEDKKPTQPKNENDSAAVEVTVEDIRSQYMSMATSPKKEQARTLIKLYAEKITDIPENKRAEVLKKLKALEANNE